MKYVGKQSKKQRRPSAGLTPIANLLPMASEGLGIDRRAHEMACLRLAEQFLSDVLKQYCRFEGIARPKEGEAVLQVSVQSPSVATQLMLESGQLLKQVNVYSKQTGIYINRLDCVIRR
ncbi:MAG: DUF721 domain-containing protein [Cyanobacteria bacterium]|nr:DUF721 domain-containing protein [Cyanobacteriota bacterium]